MSNKTSRRVWHCPPHFTRVALDKIYFATTKPIDEQDDKMTATRNWLFDHIDHRFFIGPAVSFVNGMLVTESIVGFEDPADATYFSLLRDQIYSD